MDGPHASSSAAALATSAGQAEASTRVWARNVVSLYAGRTLRPVEVVILARYRESVSGRVLEIGCGAGRVLGYLTALGGDVYGTDISPAMVAHCRRAYPQARVSVGDALALDRYPQGPFDAILAMYNLVDYFDDVSRRRLLAALREMLAPGGLLVMSTHNLGYVEAQRAGGSPTARIRQAVRLLVDRPPTWTWAFITGLPRRIWNRHRLAPLQRRAPDHAIINDSAQEHGLLLYHIRREDQLRQFNDLGYEVIECLDLDGRTVTSGEALDSAYLHFVVRSAESV